MMKNIKPKSAAIIIILVFVCILFSGLTAAWGQETHKYICEKAVLGIWGEDSVGDCLLAGDLQLQESVCEIIREVKDEGEYDNCIKKTSQGEFIHPSVVPDAVFNDTWLHYDYSRCPIPEREVLTRKWICNESGKNLAIEQAMLWFNKAREAQDECMRVYEFCIGSNYFSDSYMPLYQTMYSSEESGRDMENGVDNAITGGEFPWTVHVFSVFKHKGMRDTQGFEIKSQDIEEIIEDLIKEGGSIAEFKPYIPEREDCDDGIKNQDETDIDCGGSCKPCTDGMNCLSNSDCKGNYCHENSCRTPSCSDGIKNQGEEDVDCGGSCNSCPKPAEYKPKQSTGYDPMALILLLSLPLILIICTAALILTGKRGHTPKPVKSEPREGKPHGKEDLMEERGKSLDESLEGMKKRLEEIEKSLGKLGSNTAEDSPPKNV